MLHTIVFLPLLAALVAGLGNRALGNTLAKGVTTGALIIACALSWAIFVPVLSGAAVEGQSVMEWFRSGDLVVDWSLRLDTLTAVMLVVTFVGNGVKRLRQR